MIVAAIGMLGLIVALLSGAILTWPFVVCCVFFIVLGLVLDFWPWHHDTRTMHGRRHRR